MRSGEPFIWFRVKPHDPSEKAVVILPTCMMSSQLGQPLRRKSTGVCMMEQSRQARKFFDLAWLGIGAAGAVDPMAALAETS